MTPPGHLATAYLVVRGARASDGLVDGPLWHVAPAWLGALLPDLTDKSLQWLGLTPYGRTVGHSALLWALLLGAWLLVSRRARPGFARRSGLVLVGALSHLGADLVDDAVEGLERSGYVFSAWFGWPFTNPDMWNTTSPHLLDPMPHAVTVLELATVTTCLLHVAYVRQSGRVGRRLAKVTSSAR